MRVVLDSNVLIAAFVARGTCAELLEHCAREHQLLASEYILEEVRRNLASKAGVSARNAEAAVKLLRTRLTLVEPIDLGRRVRRDTEDDPILGTAVAAQCELLVSGDKDLLEMGEYETIRIVSPRGFWSHERPPATEGE